MLGINSCCSSSGVTLMFAMLQWLRKAVNHTIFWPRRATVLQDTWYLARDTPIRIHFFPFFLFFILFTNIFALSFFSLPPINSRNSDPGGSHSRLFSLLPTIRSCLACSSRADFSSSLVDLGRTVCLPTL